MGDGAFLCASHARDLARASADTDHVRTISVFTEPALPGRERVHVFWSGTAAGVADRTRRNRGSPPADGSLHSTRGTTARARVRRRVAKLQKESAPMAVAVTFHRPDRSHD